jgi:LysR family transcriptional regulator, cys regulon transcriptional activator
MFLYHTWHHAIIVPAGHPLEWKHSLSLEDIAAYPVITYHDGVTGREKVDKAFAKADLAPDIAMSALDADVIKVYVELGLGVGIIAGIGFDPERDARLRMLSGSHLFEASTSRIAVRRGSYLRGYAYRFIELCESKLSEAMVKSALVD